MIDISIILLYFIVVAIIGITKGASKVSDLEDFAVAKKSMSIPLLVFTFLATSFGAGSTVGDAAKIYKDGVIFLFGMSGFLIFCIFMISFIAKYFDERFKNMVSPGDIIGHFYGKKAELAVGILGLFVSTLIVAGQIKGIGVFISYYSDINHRYVTVTAGLLIAAYTSIGGVRAVTLTDVFQWIVITIVLPSIVVLVYIKAGSFTEIYQAIPKEKLSIIEHPKFYEYLALFITGCLPFLWMHPPLIQRYLMTKNYRGIRAMYISELIARPVVMSLVALLAFSCIKILPDIESDNLIPDLLNHVLDFPGLKGLVISMILAAGMSTADSHLNASSVMLTKHVIFNFINISNPKKQLLILRAVTVILSCCAMFIAFIDIEIVHIIMYGFCLWGVGFSIPMMFGLLKINVKDYMYWASLISGMLSFAYVKYIMKLPGFMPPVIAISLAFALFSSLACINNIKFKL